MALGACGALDTDSKEILAAIKERKEEAIIASYKVGNSTAYIRVLLGGSSQKHVHIDVYKKEAFGKLPPKATHKRKDVEKILDQYMGEKISTRSYGRFRVPVAELPEGGLIRSTFIGVKQGDLSIKVSGASLVVKGAPIRKLEWQFAEKDMSLMVVIDARLEVEIRKDYLIDQLRLLDSGFRLFVLGERADDTD